MAFAQKVISTRRGTVIVAAVAALLAAAFILVYLNSYRDSVRSAGAPVTVLVARTTIPKGTPGSVVAAKSMYASTTIRQSQLRDGAFSDAASLRGRAAARDVYQGQQLTSADFSASAKSLASTLTGRERVVAVPLDAAHGVIDHLQAGDRVDVFAGFNGTQIRADGTPLNGGQTRAMLRLIMQNATVVAIDKVGGGVGASASTTVSLKVDDRKAAKLAFASDYGKLWLALRPSTGAKPSRPDIATVETLILGIPPVTVLRSLGGRP